MKLDNLKKMLANVLDEIGVITDLLYKQEIKVAYEKFNTVLVELADVIDSIFAYRIENEKSNIEIDSLVTKLSEALQAMEAGDTVLLADILRYEIVEQLREIHSIL